MSIVQQTSDWFVKQKPMVSCSFTCDQICNNHCYDFGHTLFFSFLSRTWMFSNWTQKRHFQLHMIAMNLVTPKAAAQLELVCNKPASGAAFVMT